MHKWLIRKWWIVIGTLVLVMILPISLAAATSDSQVILVLSKVIEGMIDAGRDAYCAVGVTAFCP